MDVSVYKPTDFSFSSFPYYSLFPHLYLFCICFPNFQYTVYPHFSLCSNFQYIDQTLNFHNFFYNNFHNFIIESCSNTALFHTISLLYAFRIYYLFYFTQLKTLLNIARTFIAFLKACTRTLLTTLCTRTYPYTTVHNVSVNLQNSMLQLRRC